MDEAQLIMLLRMLLGLPEGATLDEIASAVTAKMTGNAPAAEPPPAPESSEDSAAMSAVRSALGVSSTAEALAAIRGARESAEAARVLRSRVEALEAAARTREVEDLIRDHADRIPPSLASWARTQTPDALRAYVAHAPPIVSERLAPAADPAAAATAADLDACRRFGTDPKIVAEIRARRVGGV